MDSRKTIIGHKLWESFISRHLISMTTNHTPSSMNHSTSNLILITPIMSMTKTNHSSSTKTKFRNVLYTDVTHSGSSRHILSLFLLHQKKTTWKTCWSTIRNWKHLATRQHHSKTIRIIKGNTQSRRRICYRWLMQVIKKWIYY